MEDVKSEEEREIEHEEGKLCCSLSFEIDGHKVSMTSGFDYETRPGLATMGWVFGISVGEVLVSMRPYMDSEQWKDFVGGVEDHLQNG